MCCHATNTWRLGLRTLLQAPDSRHAIVNAIKCHQLYTVTQHALGGNFASIAGHDELC